tara:strand:- start:353 stop:829 length:477 start_codon:yes stop_codon:yes gene_type:complete
MHSFLKLHDICIKKGISIAVAESCTSGRIASSITAISGASSFFKGGILAYNNDVKVNILGVSKLVIKQKTEVSSEVVEEMAKNARKIISVDFAVSTSGYAGPSGGNSLNPIGTVYIGISSLAKTTSKRFYFKGDRESVINQTVIASVDFLLQELKNIT